MSPDARGFACDMADTAQIATLIDDVEKAFGQLDILVNNAGLTRDNVMMRIKDEDWDAVIDTNLRGAFATMRAATRGMMKRRWGRIINISSIVGIIGNRGQTPYAASKAGLIALSKMLARELAADGIRVNTIAPGSILFPGGAWERRQQADPDGIAAFIKADMPYGRFGRPEEVAAMTVFVASPRASLVTGACIPVDGAQSRSNI